MSPAPRYALIASSDPVLVARATEGLRNAGFECEATNSALAALARIEGQARPWTVLVADLDLAGVPMTDVIAVLAAVSPRTAVLACSTERPKTAPRATRLVAKPALASEFAAAARELPAVPIARRP